MTSPFVILGLLEDASVHDIKMKWRALAFKHHPDLGGCVEDFEVFRAAYVAALNIAENRLCTNCKGTGKIVKNGTFGSIKLPCPECQ